ncbi:hypothetical protein EW026_g1769 [Hermanssonia centrifuga]|uniref:Man(5)GlcNAc(2)-PP-dolichol translocation protein RFT1 n=1 Tax=Hermanssonia centrifuga TaxID=98765 RepID=A0A4S4KS70_9APHY|nr:hypothetical protein EW026_g1769 [Hermanssonia centrifuga]
MSRNEPPSQNLASILVRLVSPQVFGTAAIQFELLLSTILFLSREGIRNALLRASPSNGTEPGKSRNPSPLISNIALLPILLGIPITVLSAFTYLYTSSYTTASQPHFRLAVTIYALAAFCELLSEPLYIRAQNELRFDVRVRAEGAAVAFKTVTAFLVLVLSPPEWALVAFALGQAAYGLITLVEFLRVYGRDSEFWLRKVTIDVHGNKVTQYFDPTMLHLSAAMTIQSVVKHFLTEGDKFLVSRLSPLADQGGYAVASNYGSLIARIVFQPIEETSRIFFSKTLSSSSTNAQEDLQAASNTLSVLLLLFTHLFLLLVTFAPPYLPLALTLVLPSRYLQTSAPAILRTYVYYIPTMAFNGVLEAFFASTATPADLRAQSRWMLACSVGFVGASVGFARVLGLGDAGLVWANILNLWLRASYAWFFVKRFFACRGVGKMVQLRNNVPPFGVLCTFAASAIVTRWSGRTFGDAPLTLHAQFGHVAIGVTSVAACLVACFLWERKTVLQGFSLLRRK